MLARNASSEPDRARFENMTRNWTCHVDRQVLSKDFLFVMKRREPSWTEDRFRQAFVESIHDDDDAAIDRRCLQAVKQIVWDGLTRVAELNPSLIDDTLRRDFGELRIVMNEDCGGGGAGGCFIPNAIFAGGKLIFAGLDILDALTVVYPDLAARRWEDCSRAADSGRKGICEYYQRYDINSPKNKIFHEVLHYLRLDNLSPGEHRVWSRHDADVVYCCAAQGYVDYASEREVDGQKYYYTKTQCLACAQAARDEGGRVFIDSGKDGSACDRIDFSRLKKEW